MNSREKELSVQMASDAHQVNPITALSVSLTSKPGAYALLLGSGISRAAQIPTGWDIVLDLVRRIASTEGLECGDAPAEWYRQRHGADPSYSDLLGRLGPTPAERSQIIRDYIEPSLEEREFGLKLPTEAHRAIAELISSGHVRVVLTTNFDRLLESALADLGVVPAIIDSVDATKGTLPLVHNNCTIIKLHGDYIDARIRNTTDELQKYSSPINRLLDQIMYEYGLIVCGWSGEWDTALVTMMKRRQSPWFSTYWVAHGEPRDAAHELIASRSAKVIINMSADEFFTQLADNVSALEQLRNPELVSATMARAAVKRYIDDPSRRIRLHDLVVGEANRVRRAIDDEPHESYAQEFTQEELQARLTRYENLTETLRTLLATGCYWGEDQHAEHWIAALERLDSPIRVQGNYFRDWLDLRRYPALMALYTAGIAAVARGQYQTLSTVLERPTALDEPSGERIPFLLKNFRPVLTEYASTVLMPGTIKQVVFYLYFWHNERLWVPIKEYAPESDRFQSFFDRFEYLAGLVRTDMGIQLDMSRWAPVGMFAWRNHGTYGSYYVENVSKEIEREGDDWPPLKAGLFGGSMERLLAARAVYDDLVRHVRFFG